METCRWIHGHTVPETTPSNKNCVRWDIHVIKVEWNIRVLNLMPWYGTLLCKSLKPPLFSLSFVREMGATIYWNAHIVDEEKPICTILFLSFFSGSVFGIMLKMMLFGKLLTLDQNQYCSVFIIHLFWQDLQHHWLRWSPKPMTEPPVCFRQLQELTVCRPPDLLCTYWWQFKRKIWHWDSSLLQTRWMLSKWINWRARCSS